MQAQAVQEQHLGVQGKTEQRVSLVIATLRESDVALTYADLTERTDTAYDSLLYILATLVEIGVVKRSEDEVSGPGRPKAHFSWDVEAARGMGPRSAA